MTITLHWWMVSLFFFVLGIVRLGTPRRDWDFVTGIDGFLWLAVSVAIPIGHFLG